MKGDSLHQEIKNSIFFFKCRVGAVSSSVLFIHFSPVQTTYSSAVTNSSIDTTFYNYVNAFSVFQNINTQIIRLTPVMTLKK